MYYVYILRCADNSLYTGITTDVEKRIQAHNRSARGAKYTRSRRPVTLVYAKRFRTKSRALTEEYRIKQLARQEKRLLIQKSGNVTG